MCVLTRAWFQRVVQADLIDSRLIHVDERGLENSQQEFLLLKENLSFVWGYVHVHTL